MDEIKFRVWDKRYGRLDTIKSIDFVSAHSHCTDHSIAPPVGAIEMAVLDKGGSVYGCDLILLQYTGKDKNGEEIYSEINKTKYFDRGQTASKYKPQIK